MTKSSQKKLYVTYGHGSNIKITEMGAVDLNVTDTIYAKISPIYLNLEN